MCSQHGFPLQRRQKQAETEIVNRFGNWGFPALSLLSPLWPRTLSLRFKIPKATVDECPALQDPLRESRAALAGKLKRKLLSVEGFGFRG